MKIIIHRLQPIGIVVVHSGRQKSERMDSGLSQSLNKNKTSLCLIGDRIWVIFCTLLVSLASSPIQSLSPVLRTRVSEVGECLDLQECSSSNASQLLGYVTK